MESIYFVLTWLCHRRCEHCYEDRFHPYYGDELTAVVAQSRANVPRIIENLPARMMYLDLNDADEQGRYEEKRGRIIVAGGEVLLEPVRESVLYPALRQMRARYANRGGVDLIVQTTGDLLTPRLIDELLVNHVDVISVSGLDDFHDGIEPQKLQGKLEGWFQAASMTRWTPPAVVGRQYSFFGATPDQWIGKLWPRGRAFQNELSTAGITDNFCNRWSGGLNFLQYRHSGSEVSIDPEGNVFPCCVKTRKPIGNLLEQPLETVLAGLIGNPIYEAISMGHPERMGITHGWSVERFLEKSRVTQPSGRVYQNLCVGCDAFHEEVLLARPEALVQIASRV